MDNTGLVGVIALVGAAVAYLSKIWRKVKALDVKIDMLAPDGNVVALDVRIGGRRRTDPPVIGIGPITTVVPVDRRD